MKKIFIFGVPVFLFLAAILTSFFMSMAGCKRGDNLAGAILPLNVPTSTPTPATGAFNCYVYDNGGKQGVTVVLLDPSLSNPITNTTDQFGNAIFNPTPLLVGNYTAEVLAQGRYGLSALPITITNPSQGAVSCQFAAASQAMTIVSGAPVSFVAGNGTFNLGVSYIQPGTLDVPITVTTNTLPSGWNTAPATFVLGMSNPTTVVAVNKIGCAVNNQPLTFIGTDFLGLAYGPMASTTLIRNFPVNVQLSLTETVSTCSCFGGVCRSSLNSTFTLNSPSDCGLSWTLTVGSRVFTLTNGQSAGIGTGNTTGCKSITGETASLSSVLGTASGTGSNGVIINKNF